MNWLKRSPILGVLVLTLAGCDTGPTAPDVPSFNDPGVPVGADAMSTTAGVPPELLVSDLANGASQADVANRWISHAERLYLRATQLAGPNPEPPIPALLGAARAFLDQALDAFAGGQYEAAIQHARASVEKSQEVIEALSPDRGHPDLEDRAAQAIDQAEALFREAVDLAGSDPERRVRTALAKAEDLLDEAVRAFEAGEFQQAIRQALHSARISQTVIRYLTS